MNRTLGVIIITVVVAAALYWFVRTRPSAQPGTGASAAAPTPATKPSTLSGLPTNTQESAGFPLSEQAITATAKSLAATRTPAAVVTAPAAVAPLPPDLAKLEPMTVLENMRTTIRLFGSTFGGNPVGTNPEITRALHGENPKQINFLKEDGNRVNDRGELVDVWGTPYFFHQLSATQMEIRSAGPDRIMWTADDLVIK
jgi:hypothetical protein